MEHGHIEWAIQFILMFVFFPHSMLNFQNVYYMGTRICLLRKDYIYICLDIQIYICAGFAIHIDIDIYINIYTYEHTCRYYGHTLSSYMKTYSRYRIPSTSGILAEVQVYVCCTRGLYLAATRAVVSRF